MKFLIENSNMNETWNSEITKFNYTLKLLHLKFSYGYKFQKLCKEMGAYVVIPRNTTSASLGF